MAIKTKFQELPLIGIVTVLYNSDDVLPGFFKSLASQINVNYKLYVYDNSPTDFGFKLAQELSEKHSIDTVCVFNNSNYGVARGNNQGILQAIADGCEYVLLANNDTEFAENAIFELYSETIKNGDLVATSKIMYYEKPSMIWYAGGHINSWLMRTPHYGLKENDVGQFDGQLYVGYAPTCFMLINSEVFSEVGLMDEDYFVYSDDTDFVWRLNSKSIKIRFVSSSVVLHKVSSSTGGERSLFTIYYTNRNRIFFIRKNFNGLRYLFAISYIFFTRIIQLSKLPWDGFKTGWKGVRDGFRMEIKA